MTLYAVKAVGFDKGSEITLFLVLTIPSIFGSYIYGHLVDRIRREAQPDDRRCCSGSCCSPS